MNFEAPNIIPAIPEITLLSLACLVLVVDLFVEQENRIITYLLSQVSLLIVFVLTLVSFAGETQLSFSNTFVRDAMSDVLKLGVYARSLSCSFMPRTICVSAICLKVNSMSWACLAY